MKITNDELYDLVHGSIHVEVKDDGYNMFYRCNQEQIDHLKNVDTFLYDRALFQASVTIEFDTNATSIIFNYKVFKTGSYDSFDVYVDGFAYQFIELVSYIKQATVEVNLPEGHKRVVLYLPCDAEVGVKDFFINGEYQKVSKKPTKVLCYGDSITQGYGSLRSSITYINTIANQLEWEVINQGIGGYYFDESYISTKGITTPNMILVSFGTNQLWSEDKYDRIDKFFHRLSEVYPNIPTIVITPIWRGDRQGSNELILEMAEYINKTCTIYENVVVIDGYKLIPHIEYYFKDKLHPNGLGMEVYGRNLVKVIKKLNW